MGKVGGCGVGWMEGRGMKLLSCYTYGLIFLNGTPKQRRKSRPGKGKGWVAVQYGELGRIGCWDKMILIVIYWVFYFDRLKMA